MDLNPGTFGTAAFAVVFVLAVLAAWAGKRWLSLILTLLLAADRGFLVERGWTYQANQIRYLDIALAVAVLATIGFASFTLLGSSDASVRTAVIAAVLTLPVAAYGLLQVVFPGADVQAGSSCQGASVAGSRFQAKTGTYGLNARSGPETNYAPERRFDADCAVGADGYCIGEPVADLTVPVLPDVRWLRLHHTHSYIAGGTVFALSPERDLGDKPEADCPLGLHEPTITGDATLKTLPARQIRIAAVPERTRLIGFSYNYIEKTTVTQVVQQLGITPKVPNAAGQVSAVLNLDGVKQAHPAATGIVLAVVSCLAAIVPSHTGAQYFAVDLRTGRSVRLTTTTKFKNTAGRLREAACRIDPDVGPDQVASAAQSPP